jgi:rubredoxin
MTEASFNYGHSRTVAGREMDVDGFLTHRSRERSGGAVLRSSEWKKDGKLDLWLHTGTRIASVWRHSFWRVVERTDKETRKTEKVVVFSPWNCHEDEEVLRRQYKRRADGARQAPPERCPFDKLSEAIRAMAVRGEIRWTDPVLKFEGDDRSQTVIVRAGDFWNAFGSKDLSEEEIAQLRRVGVNRRDAWKTALMPKCSYLFVAADDANLADGARILIEGEALGRAMQRAIEGEIDRHGSKELGNPFKNPYMFRWTFDDSKDFADKYGAKVIGKKPTDEVLAVIRDAEPPDTSDELAFGDVDELRALLEAHALLKLPLDACFPPRDPASAQKNGAKADEGSDADGDLPLRFDCDHCGAKEVMGEDDFECPKCGAEYEVVDGNTVLGARPCLSCKAPVALPGVRAPGKFGDHVKCAKCGAEHFEEHGERDAKAPADTPLPVNWFIVEAKPVEPLKEEPKPVRRRR